MSFCKCFRSTSVHFHSASQLCWTYTACGICAALRCVAAMLGRFVDIERRFASRKHRLTRSEVCCEHDRKRRATKYLLFSFHCFLLYFKSHSHSDSVLSPSFYSVLRPIKMAENVVIKELIHKPFSVRPLHDKFRIVNKGNTSSQNQDRTIYKTFFISQYEN